MNSNIKKSLLFACVMTVLDLLSYLFKSEGVISIIKTNNDNINLIAEIFFNFGLSFLISLLFESILEKQKKQ